MNTPRTIPLFTPHKLCQPKSCALDWYEIRGFNLFPLYDSGADSSVAVKLPPDCNMIAEKNGANHQASTFV
jgi:hypothetical protein